MDAMAAGEAGTILPGTEPPADAVTPMTPDDQGKGGLTL